MIRRLLAYLNADRFWVWIDRFSRIMVFVGIPAFFVNQYIRAEHDRASNTLEFVTRFQDSQLVRYRYRLLAPWMAKNVTALEKAGVVEDMARKLIETDNLQPAIFHIVDFYESLVVCIEIDRCNGEIARDYFLDYAARFYCLYRGYISRVKTQQRVVNYGDRLKKFVQDFSNKPNLCD